MDAVEMIRRIWPVALLCSLICLVFAYSFWISAQKSPEQGGPAPITD
jgi:hypothetical protein